uniref:Uncharacterized protein n=1 Tax=Anguilla anguilla TaxID=7936 RepID=A0A0E9PK54_ANGAN
MNPRTNIPAKSLPAGV